MTLPAAPPAQTKLTVQVGDAGWPAYAVQTGLNGVGESPALAADGAFGPATEAALLRFQRAHGLYPDAVAGPATQGKVVSLTSAACESAVASPIGYARGLTLNEGGGLITTVNWAIAGGVDCGDVQLRCLGPPFDQAKLALAFNPRRALLAALASFLDRRDLFLGSAYGWSKGNRERAGRCAALAHNWPAGADGQAHNGHVGDPNGAASWVPPGVRFPDGTPVTTKQGWADFYALGGPHGPGRVTRFITDWR